MATPYWQLRRDEVPSTQDLASGSLRRLPVVAMASAQGQGRGRSGAGWLNAPRALAVSVAFIRALEDRRPLSLMAGVAACRALGPEVGLKWPNDLESSLGKVGGILVEQSDRVAVVGLGVNLWWPSPPDGVSATEHEDPGPDRFLEVGAAWAAALLELVDTSGWPLEEYVGVSTTLGKEITWDPDGSGTAVGIGEDGALLVDGEQGRIEIHAGAVRHVRA